MLTFRQPLGCQQPISLKELKGKALESAVRGRILHLRASLIWQTEELEGLIETYMDVNNAENALKEKFHRRWKEWLNDSSPTCERTWQCCIKAKPIPRDGVQLEACAKSLLSDRPIVPPDDRRATDILASDLAAEPNEQGALFNADIPDANNPRGHDIKTQPKFVTKEGYCAIIVSSTDTNTSRQVQAGPATLGIVAEDIRTSPSVFPSTRKIKENEKLVPRPVLTVTSGQADEGRSRKSKAPAVWEHKDDVRRSKRLKSKRGL
jgi:hypothetical protein